MDVEKSSAMVGASYYDDAWNVEDSVYIGVAKTVDARILVANASPSITDYTKI